jgi:hypothetical protein
VFEKENYYTPYREIMVRGKKTAITPHGHIEERLKTVRKHEGVRAREPRCRKRIAEIEIDTAGK